jgi:hypothetical protein
MCLINDPFHRYRGLIFSTVGVVLFVLALALLQKVEKRRDDAQAERQSAKKRQSGAWRAADCL